ncbi:MAG TPA: patatin-like phospholipase family protein [Vicinamibacterales bacterium]|nr:patatin-like phospholipase family protein [Vicinamibacterales bacterium]
MNDEGLALVLTGGGARAAYQVGFLQHLASRHPHLAPGILTGVSAGGIIATWLALRDSSFGEAIDQLSEVWQGLRTEDVFRVDPGDLTSRVTRWGVRLVSGGAPGTPRARSLLDTAPLRQLLARTLKPDSDGQLPAIARNLAAGTLHALALTASSYTTGQSVTWVQDVEGCGVMTSEPPERKSAGRCLGVDHVMASSALPFFFPAIEIDGAWYGDGGIRLTAPLSPAIDLGAQKIIAISTRHPRTRREGDRPAVSGYPPPAQVAGVLLNAIFLDLLDADAMRLQQLNRLIRGLPPNARNGLRPIDLLILRPSQDLGRLANEFEAELPRPFRFLVRGLGSRETRSNDMLSLLMFQPDYITKVMELGRADARARSEEIEAFLEQKAEHRQRPTAREKLARYLSVLRKDPAGP